MNWNCARCGYAPKRVGQFPVFARELVGVEDGWRADFAARLAEAEPRHFWFRARNRLVVWALGHYFPRAANFLEIGCGGGYVLSGVRGSRRDMRLTGSDLFPEALVVASRRVPGADFLQMDARRIPFEGEFDVIGAFDVLEHIEEDDAVLEGIHRALRPGGGVILTVPLHPWLWSVTDEYACHKRRYTLDELRSKLQRAGFDLLRQTAFVSLLLPLLLLSRRRLPRRAEDFDPSTELHLHPVVQAALESVMTVERGLIQLGRSFPFGSSLLAVGGRVDS